jgi:type III secretion protein Q
MTDSAMLKFSPAVLPRMSLSESQAHSLIARHGAALRIRIPRAEALRASQPAASRDFLDGAVGDDSPDDIWNLGIAPGQPQSLKAAGTVRRDLEWAGGHLRLTLSPDTITSWLNANLPAVALDELSDPLVATAVEVLLEYVFSALDAASTCGRPRVIEGEANDAPLPHGWTLTARHNASGHLGFALLEADTLGLLLLANLLKRAPQTSNGLNEDDLPVTVYADLGRTVLSAANLSGLRAQDTIFIDDYRVTSDGDLWLVASGHGVRLRPQQDSYCVTQGWTPMMNDLLDSSRESDADAFLDDGPAPIETDKDFDVDAVPVTLTFSLGERQVTLGELRHLQPGEVFDLARPLAGGPVMVRANGRLFATGDVVDIDGRVGVTLRALGEPEA